MDKALNLYPSLLRTDMGLTDPSLSNTLKEFGLLVCGF